MQGTRANGVEITMPQLAESVVAATIGKWLKKPGDFVLEYEEICDIITDKVSAPLPSTAEGILREILVPEGATVDVGTVLCIIDAASGTVTGKAAGHVPAGAANDELADLDVADKKSNAGNVRRNADLEGDQSMRYRYSPAVRKIADENSVDLEQIIGTGLGGRISRKDVLQYIESGVKIPATDAVKVPLRTSGLHLPQNSTIPDKDPDVQFDEGRSEYHIDVTPVRNTIANRMRQSVSEIPHAWTMIEVDVTKLVLLRNKHKDEFVRKEGVNLTYLAFLLKAVVSAIKDYPMMNSFWAVDKIVVKRDINISLAVGTEDSIWTPVIRKADQKNISGLAREIDDLAKRTRAGKLTPGDMQGGTFTINNTGSFGSILSYPIINYPQAAILTFESIVKRPVVIQDMIAVRSMVNLCLSLDHRILDGVICGRFLQRVKENLESYHPDSQLY
ncbi:MAG TPA: dihydrolipoamide acetyltransferase family protein [Bacilli bacterium]